MEIHLSCMGWATGSTHVFLAKAIVSFSVSSLPGASVTIAVTSSPNLASGTPMAAASMISGCS